MGFSPWGHKSLTQLGDTVDSLYIFGELSDPLPIF